jgi:hypothetical protein
MPAWIVPENLSDETVTLRAWEFSDAEWLFEGFNDPEVRAQTEQAEGRTVESVQTAKEMGAQRSAPGTVR